MPLLPFVAVAAAQSLVVDCLPNDRARVVGLPPFEVRCTASDVNGALVEADWLFGDGGSATGSTVSHTYDEVGRYQLSATSESLDTGTLPEEGGVEVVVCGPPVPRFDVHFLGGLTYTFENLTSPDPGCLSDLRWDVFAGKGQQGEPLLTTVEWSPEVTFPDEGTWTVVLSVGGIGGVAGSAVTLDARGGFTDAYDEAPFGVGWCSTGPTSPGALAMAAALSFVRRRRC